MNKTLYVKVKDLCKDTGLSEKYLTAITEKMGGGIADDSTDEGEIEKVANQIAELAKEGQAEATRWANKKKENLKNEGGEGGEKPKPNEKNDEPNPNDERLKKLEDELAALKAEKQMGARKDAIIASMEKHKIPAYLRDRLAKSISDEEDIEAAVSGFKSDLITNGLPTERQEGSKAASEKQIEEAADSLLNSITAK